MKLAAEGGLRAGVRAGLIEQAELTEWGLGAGAPFAAHWS